jgi:hypothetical protein
MMMLSSSLTTTRWKGRFGRGKVEAVGKVAAKHVIFCFFFSLPLLLFLIRRSITHYLLLFFKKKRTELIFNQHSSTLHSSSLIENSISNFYFNLLFQTLSISTFYFNLQLQSSVSNPQLFNSQRKIYLLSKTTLIESNST